MTLWVPSCCQMTFDIFIHCIGLLYRVVVDLAAGDPHCHVFRHAVPAVDMATVGELHAVAANLLGETDLDMIAPLKKTINRLALWKKCLLGM